MSEGKRVLTVGITTRNRHDSLQRCVESLRLLDHLSPEILIFDDASDVPVADTLIAQPRLRIIRDDRGPGNIVGRNTLMTQASADAVLLLDDDAALLEAAGIERALEILSRDSDVAAIAFAQANEDGRPWPETMQPGLGQSPRYVAAFIGFAHLLRRDVFLRLGGYRERFVFYGEEKEYCLRLLDRGLRVVYLPDALVIHAQDASGRTPQRYLRYVTRNDCLNALYNEPLRRVVWLVPARLALYFRMRARWGVDDPAGLRWILKEVAANAGAALRARKPVSRRTLAAWRRLRDGTAPYPPAIEQRP
ncbi:MAG: glycosyltransferase [Acidobacteriota bacterium]|nr:glycosyltransferase [Acidobacteriota bacterium]